MARVQHVKEMIHYKNNISIFFCSMEKNDPDQDLKIRFICENINDLRRNFRKEILQIMLGSQIPESKIYEKGGGTQIKIVDIPKELINTIYNYVKKKLECVEEII